MVELKSEAHIEAMSAAGAVVAEALRAIVASAAPGRSTDDLDGVASDVLATHGADSPFLNYHPRWAPVPFPAVRCISVNDAIVHGIPTDLALADGDLVSVDFGATLNGWCGDAARSFVVGTPRPGDILTLRPGLVIAIEPMLIADGTEDYPHDSDGWTLRTASGARAAHSEHTVALTRDGVRILTS